MPMTGSTASIRAIAQLLAIAALALVVAGCQTPAGKGAAEGAGTGAIAGAVGGAVVALVFGEENFAGLEALADCKHDQSLRAAEKGRQSKNPNYALAGLWLEILSYADQGQESQARALFPTLVKQDWNIGTTVQAESKMREGTTALGNIREEYDRPRVCAA